MLTVVSQPQDGGTVTLDPSYSDNLYRVDDIVTLTAQPSPGYLFVEWSGDVSGIADVTHDNVSFVMTDVRSIAANFVESWVRYTMTTAADPAAGGSIVVSPSQDNYTPNQVVSVSAVSAPGYVFSHWAGALDSTTSPADLRLNGNKSVTAVFNPVLSVQVEEVGTGTVEADPPVTASGYQVGTAVTLTARPSLGYLFDKWTGEVAGIPDVNQAAVTVVVNEPRTVTARFVASPRFYLTQAVQNQGSGSLAFDPVQPSDGYLASQQVKVYALAEKGYVFSHWSGDASGTNAILTLDMLADQTIVAVFDPKVTVESDPLEGGNVDITPPQSSGGYVLGSEVTIEATALEGYRFSGWSGDVSGSDNPLAIVVDSPKTVTANFVKESVLARWWFLIAAGVALTILVGLPLELTMRRRSESP